MRKLLLLIPILIFSYSTIAAAETREDVAASLSAELNIEFIEQSEFELKGVKIVSDYESITYFLIAKKNQSVKRAVIVYKGYNKNNFQTFAGYYGSLVQALLPNWNPKKSKTYEEMRGKHSYLLYSGGATAFLIEEDSSTGNLNVKVDLNMQNKFAQAILEPK